MYPKGRFYPAKHLAQGDVRIDGLEDSGYIVVWVKASGPIQKRGLGLPWESTCPVVTVTSCMEQRKDNSSNLRMGIQLPGTGW